MNEKQSPSEESQSADDATNAASQNSLSGKGMEPQPEGQRGPKFTNAPYDTRATKEACSPDNKENEPSAHVVLYQPEIPQNTGNIGRTCVAVNAKLWIVRPAAFQLDDAKLRRAGLDYWAHLERGDAVNWDDLVSQLHPRPMYFLSKFAKRTIWEADFRRGDVLVFGRETSGLPASILDPEDPRALRLPTSEHVRSLNLATTAGIVLYEHQRQTAGYCKDS
ncbi:MAG: tRNA (cytidine(34)-2'-O)-methyltransferase [Rubripirellula sp.]